MGFFGFLFWFVISIVVGVLASDKGRSGIGWFFISLLITPVLSLIILLCVGDSDEKKEASLKKAMSIVNQEKKKTMDEKVALTQEQAIAELEKAKKLLALEVISQEEYDAKKAELMPILRNEEKSEILPAPKAEISTNKPPKNDTIAAKKNQSRIDSRRQHSHNVAIMVLIFAAISVIFLIVYTIIHLRTPEEQKPGQMIAFKSVSSNTQIVETNDENKVVIGRWSLKSVYDSSIEIMEIYKKDGKYYSNERGGRIILLDKRGDRYYYTGMDYANDSYYKIVNGNLRICDDELGDYTEHSGYIITKLK